MRKKPFYKYFFSFFLLFNSFFLFRWIESLSLAHCNKSEQKQHSNSRMHFASFFFAKSIFVCCFLSFHSCCVRQRENAVEFICLLLFFYVIISNKSTIYSCLSLEKKKIIKRTEDVYIYHLKQSIQCRN